MNLGIKHKSITVKELYDYAKYHNCLDSEVNTVMDIICRERNPIGLTGIKRESIVSPMHNICTVDFGTSKHYNTEEVLQLFS